MRAFHSSSGPLDISALSGAATDDLAREPLPAFITIPLMLLTSAGLWAVIYKLGCAVAAVVG